VEDCQGDSSALRANPMCGLFAYSQRDCRGSINVTASGRTCQAWSSQTPHAHKHSPLNLVSEGLEGNCCRNPTGKSLAWCFTTDEDQHFEFCDVPFCEQDPQIPESTDCGTLALRQRDHRGDVNQTESGLACQNWLSQEPHPHSFLPEQHASSGLEGNKCRNPDRSEKA